MGAHGTLEEALANVSSYAAADAQNELDLNGPKDGRSSRKSGAKKSSKKAHKADRKHEQSDKKKEKDSKKAKHGKRSKSSKRSKSRRENSPESGSGSDSGSDSGGGKPAGRKPQGGLQVELARARHAARCTRELLLRYPEQRRDLRQLLWTVDQGSALDVSGVADAAMRDRLIELLSSLPLRCTKKGVFLRQPGGSSVLTQLGHLFEETPAQLRSACDRAAAAEAAAAPAQAGAPPADDKATSTAGNSAAGGLPAEQTSAAADAVGLDAASNGQAGAAADGRAAVGSRPASELNVVREGSMELDYGTDDDAIEPAVEVGPEPSPEGGASVRPDIGPDCGRVVGANFEPAIGPVAGPAASEAPPEAAGAEAADHPAQGTHAVPPHAHGPARPPAELLAAAAEVRLRAYVPYSHFRVGAALRAADGRVFLGANVENAAWSPSICAERVALPAAVVAGVRDFTLLAVVGDGDGPCTPCGVCRQVLYEFAPDLVVLAAGAEGGVERFVLGHHLLPNGFGPTRLHGPAPQ